VRLGSERRKDDAHPFACDAPMSFAVTVCGHFLPVRVRSHRRHANIFGV